MTPWILYRSIGKDTSEVDAMHRHFKCTNFRTQIPQGSAVIGRYSVLPFYEELDQELASQGCRLVNTYRQHRYIANLGNWYRDLEGITPKTWPSLEAVDEEGPFVLKGETNSKKAQWDTQMFAHNMEEACAVRDALEQDGVICEQQIYVRKFERMKAYLTGFRGMPVTHEYRAFVCQGEVLTKAFYWSNYWDDVKDLIKEKGWGEPPDEFLQEVIDRVGLNAEFYVVDVGMKEDGGWMVVELNDGQMSGLSMTDPEELYSALEAMYL